VNIFENWLETPEIYCNEVYNCTFLGYYAGSIGNLLPTFRDNLYVPFSRVKIGFLTLEDATRKLFRNVGKK